MLSTSGRNFRSTNRTVHFYSCRRDTSLYMGLS